MSFGTCHNWYQTPPRNEAMRLVTNDINKHNAFNVEQSLLQTIDSAQKNIYAAFYALEYQPIVEALIAAHRRSVNIYLISDVDNGKSSGMLALQKYCHEALCASKGNDCEEKIECPWITLGNGGSGEMMINALLADFNPGKTEGTLWISASAAIRSQLNADHAVALLIESATVSIDVQRELDVMFHGLMGADKPIRNFQTDFILDGYSTKIYFAPHESPLEKLNNFIDQSETSLHFASSAFFYNVDADHNRSMVKVSQTLNAKVKGPNHFTLQGVIDSDSLKGVLINEELRPNLALYQGGIGKEIYLNLMVSDIGTYNARALLSTFGWTKEADLRHDGIMLIIENPLLVNKLYFILKTIFGHKENKLIPASFSDSKENKIIISKFSLQKAKIVCGISHEELQDDKNTMLAGHAWVELTVQSGNGNIQNLFLSDFDGSDVAPLSVLPIVVSPGDRIIIHYLNRTKVAKGEIILPPNETGLTLSIADVNNNGVWDLFTVNNTPATTDDQWVLGTSSLAELYNSQDSKYDDSQRIYDAVFISNLDGEMVAAEIKDSMILLSETDEQELNHWKWMDQEGKVLVFDNVDISYLYPGENNLSSPPGIFLNNGIAMRQTKINEEGSFDYIDTNSVTDWIVVPLENVEKAINDNQSLDSCLQSIPWGHRSAAR